MYFKSMEDLIRFRKHTYAALDMETFCLCLNFQYNRPWQLGLMEVNHETIVSEHEILVNWTEECDLKIGEVAAMITRYDHQKVLRDGINPEKAGTIMFDILEKSDYILGHNLLNFDAPLLKEYALYMGRPWKHLIRKIIDTNAIARAVKNNIPFREGDDLLTYQIRMNNNVVRGVKTNQKALAKEFGIHADENQLHSALYDLKINLQIWNKLKYMINF